MELSDIDYPLKTRLYMFIVGVTHPKDETLHLVTLMSRILVAYST